MTSIYLLLVMIIPSKLLSYKLLILMVVGSVGSYLSALAASVFALQAPETKDAGYPASTAVIAVIASGIFAILVKVVDNYLESRREASKTRNQRDEDERAKHLTFSEKMEEMTSDQWTEVLARRDALHKQELEFHQNRILSVEIAKYELRERNNLAMNEISCLQSYILDLKDYVVKKGVTDYPTYQIKSYFEIMAGVDAKVEAYAERVRAQHVSDQ